MIEGVVEVPPVVSNKLECMMEIDLQTLQVSRVNVICTHSIVATEVMTGMQLLASHINMVGSN